jgi:hypothetical protein
MGEGDKIVARFRDGRLVKGYVKKFAIDSDTVLIHEPKSQKQHEVSVDDLKALFFVKTFKGYRDYAEKKAFGIRNNPGCKVYVKFNDKESLIGFIEGDIPWDKGFSLSRLGSKAKGFFIVPCDSESNNHRVFVVGTAIEDISIMAA